MLQLIQTVDINALYWIQQNMRVSFLNMPMIILNRIGDYGIIWLLIIAVMMIWPKYRRVGLTALIAITFSLLICNIIIKPLVHRARPFEVYQYITVLINYPTDFSFPSGHASSSFSVALVLMHAYKKKGAGFLILATLIAFSRLYVGVHYPTDILGGILTGILSGVLAVLVVKMLSNIRKPAE